MTSYLRYLENICWNVWRGDQDQEQGALKRGLGGPAGIRGSGEIGSSTLGGGWMTNKAFQYVMYAPSASESRPGASIVWLAWYLPWTDSSELDFICLLLRDLFGCPNLYYIGILGPWTLDRCSVKQSIKSLSNESFQVLLMFKRMPWWDEWHTCKIIDIHEWIINNDA